MIDELAELAAAYGVESTYDDWSGAPRRVAPEAVRHALAAMDVPTGTAAEVHEALVAARSAPWRRPLPGVVVVRVGDPPAAVLRLPEGARVELTLHAEDGAEHRLRPGRAVAAERVEGRAMLRHELALPAALPPGYHRLTAAVGSDRVECDLVLAPRRCPLRPELGRCWGWAVQLYAVRSRASWGIGDFADLAALLAWSGDAGADFVLCNPLHAAAPVLPRENSPYFPASRRFVDPLYLRVETLPESAALDPAARAEVARLAAAARPTDAGALVDRDAAFRAKDAALRLLHAAPQPPGAAERLRAYADREGVGLTDFATWCALARRHGRAYGEWPEPLRHPRSPAVAHARDELAEEVHYQIWLQWRCDEQLAAAQAAGRDAGARLGLVGDLAVGVDPGGADAWALQDVLARRTTVGAPPDSFNQRGQDWRLPPLRPDRLHAGGLTAWRDLLRGVLRHAGGVRVDHATGLFRLWWVPEGAGPAEGTYVRYPARELLGVLALETERAGAIAVAEDLGTVEPGVPETLREHGVFTSAVVWFERDPTDARRRRRAADYPEQAFASVTTHDLPTAAGFWHDDTVRLQEELGLLGDDQGAAARRADAERDRAEVRALLAAEELVGADPTEAELVIALHALPARSPARLLAVSLGDAVGDRRQPNLPGTRDEYPNWRLPLADGAGRPVPLDELTAHPGVRRIVALMREMRPRTGGASRDPR